MKLINKYSNPPIQQTSTYNGILVTRGNVLPQLIFGEYSNIFVTNLLLSLKRSVVVKDYYLCIEGNVCLTKQCS